jgi:hypothetical protein
MRNIFMQLELHWEAFSQLGYQQVMCCVCEMDCGEVDLHALYIVSLLLRITSCLFKSSFKFW